MRRILEVALALALAGAAVADPVPPMINYQGRLTDAQGRPMHGAVSITFALREGPTDEVEIADEPVALNGTAGTHLAQDNLIAGTVTVTSQDGATTYAEGADYWLSVQEGRIGRTAGSAIADGGTVLVDYAFTAEEVWSETHAAVQVHAGCFHVLLGSLQPLGPGHLEGNGCYLSVTVAGEEVLPRQRIASVPYALKASDAHTVGGRTAGELGTIQRIEAGLGLTVENPTGPTVTVHHSFAGDPLAGAPFGLVPPNDAYAVGNVFYVDPQHGDDANDGLSAEAAFESFGRATARPHGAVWRVDGPVKVILLAPADPSHVVETGTVQRDNCCIVGVNWPTITNSVACAMTVCGARSIVAGLRVYHPNGNGVHVTPTLDGAHVPEGTVVVGNIFLDGGIGSSVAVEADRVLVAGNRFGHSNFGVTMGSDIQVKQVYVRHNVIFGSATAAIRFRNALECVSHDNRIGLCQRDAVRFEPGARRCQSLNDLVDVGLAGYVDLGFDNVIWTPHE